MKDKLNKKYFIIGVILFLIICFVIYFFMNYRINITKVNDYEGSQTEVLNSDVNYNDIKVNLEEINSYLEQDDFGKKLDDLMESLCNTSLSKSNCLINGSANTYGGILSISIIYTNPESDVIDTSKVYNFDLKTGDIISNTEFLSRFDISEEEFSRKLQKTYIDFFDEDNKTYIEYLNDDSHNIDDKIKDLSFDKLDDSLNNIKNTVFNADDYFIYINDDDKLEVIINNNLWVKNRPQTAFREASSYSTRKIILD